MRQHIFMALISQHSYALSQHTTAVLTYRLERRTYDLPGRPITPVAKSDSTIEVGLEQLSVQGAVQSARFKQQLIRSPSET